MDHVARAERGQTILGIGRVRWVFHCVQVIEVAKEFIESVDGGQKLIQITEVVLAELSGGITHRLERRSNGHRLRGYSNGRACLTDCGHAGAQGDLAGYEVSATCRAARLRVVIGEAHT